MIGVLASWLLLSMLAAPIIGWVLRGITRDYPTPPEGVEIVGALRKGRYTDAVLDLCRDLPMSAWQAAVDSHRLMANVDTADDVLALLRGEER